ncbi:MAG: HlyC/CorC family transporter [Clostridiales bacterium]|nr:HlyC/CorC family transporter [Clostridiales bacterium]
MWILQLHYAIIEIGILSDFGKQPAGRCFFQILPRPAGRANLRRKSKEEITLDTPIGGLLLIQVVLIAINAFCAAAEIAVVSLSETKLRHQADEGDKKAQKLLKMVLEPSGFLSTIQIAITLAGFLGSAFAAENFSDPLVNLIVNVWGFKAIPAATLNTLCVVLITLILSYFTLVFGELVPKRIAMKKTEAVARAVCGIINGMSKVVKPIVWLLSKSVNAVLRLFGIDPAADEEEVTEDEIRMMVDMGEEKGAIETNERDMIENIFEFNNMTAADCMTHRTDVYALQADESSEEILKIISESGKSRFPVYGEDLDDVLGTVNSRDFLIALSNGQQKTLHDLLRPAYFVPESVRTDVLFREMQKNKTHLAIVVDEYGGTSGLITMEDLLEEIVGDIDDEYDDATPQDIQKMADDTYRIAGGTDLETINDTLSLELPTEEEFESLGGLIYSQLATIPKDGTHPVVECFGVRIRVDEIVDRRVEWATVTVLPKETKEDEKED